MLAAGTEEDYAAYITWLADYLYRPTEIGREPLSEKEAGLELVGIETEIADWIWNHPFEDYPPEDRLPPNGARHADILHRQSMSDVLSRVPDRAIRIKLLKRFYLELAADASK